MDLKFEEILKQIADFIRTEAKTETVVGTPFMLGEFQCVPIIKIGMGLGAGGGFADSPKTGKGEGGGGGAGVGIEPLGFLVNKGDSMQFISTQHSKGLAAAMEKVPDILAKYFESQAAAKVPEVQKS